MNNFQHERDREKKHYQRLIAKIKKWDKIKVDGRIEMRKKGNTYFWYQVYKDPKTGKRVRKYIPREQKDLAIKLAKKAFYKKAMPIYERTIRYLDGEINKRPDDTALEKMLAADSPYRDLLKDIFVSLGAQKDARKWAKEPYEHGEMYQEKLKYTAANGIKVRSKGEMLIMNALDEYGIAYRYECLLMLDDGKCYPDFTVMNARTGKIYYWEHFGAMDNPEYYPGAIDKMKRYLDSHHYHGIDMITTFETNDNPFSSKLVNEIIEAYLL